MKERHWCNPDCACQQNTTPTSEECNHSFKWKIDNRLWVCKFCGITKKRLNMKVPTKKPMKTDTEVVEELNAEIASLLIASSLLASQISESGGKTLNFMAYEEHLSEKIDKFKSFILKTLHNQQEAILSLIEQAKLGDKWCTSVCLDKSPCSHDAHDSALENLKAKILAIKGPQRGTESV